MKLALAAALAALLAGCGRGPAPEPPNDDPPRPARITQFYASAGSVARGETVTLCYGVEDATAVRLDPPVEAIKPAMNRCMQTVPQRTTQYTLYAMGADGKEARESFEVRVGPPAAKPPGAPAGAANRMILFFTAASPYAVRGLPLTVCYGLQGATSVRMEPATAGVEVAAKRCVSVRPEQNTTYTLIAEGPGGKQDRETLKVEVR